MPSNGYDRNVFINCPFDPAYKNLLRPLAFTIIYLGLNPRIASEQADSGELRLEKILRLIKASRFSIHDLSRCRASDPGEYFRLNMPFELGLDSGCKKFAQHHRKKSFLILESERRSYHKSLSDMAGADLKAHGDDPVRIMHVTRDWLVQEAGAASRPHSEFEGRWDDFNYQNRKRLKSERFTTKDINRRTLKELFDDMRRWVRNQPNSPVFPAT